MSRADAGVLRMDHQPVDLAHLVTEVMRAHPGSGQGAWGDFGPRTTAPRHDSGRSAAPPTAAREPGGQRHQIHPRRRARHAGIAQGWHLGRPRASPIPVSVSLQRNRSGSSSAFIGRLRPCRGVKRALGWGSASRAPLWKPTVVLSRSTALMAMAVYLRCACRFDFASLSTHLLA